MKDTELEQLWNRSRLKDTELEQIWNRFHRDERYGARAAMESLASFIGSVSFIARGLGPGARPLGRAQACWGALTERACARRASAERSGFGLQAEFADRSMKFVDSSTKFADSSGLRAASAAASA